MQRRLYRSRSEKILGGVCGGLGEYFDVDPVIVRLTTVVLLFVTGGVVVPLYIASWIIIPRIPLAFTSDSATAPTAPEVINETPVERETPDERTLFVRILPGALLVLFGAFALLRHEFWWDWVDLMPVALILIGMYFVMRQYDNSRDKSDAQSLSRSAEAKVDNGDSSLSSNGGES